MTYRLKVKNLRDLDIFAKLAFMRIEMELQLINDSAIGDLCLS